MWISDRLLDFFKISQTSFNDLREELAALKAERDVLTHQLTVAQTNFDWLRVKVNQLELEKTALMEKAYNIKLPVPEILRAPQIDPTFDPKHFDFNDMGDKLAKQYGLPSYDN